MRSIKNFGKFRYLFLISLTSIGLFSFQNCTRTSFSMVQPVVDPPVDQESIKDVLVETDMNTSAVRELPHDQVFKEFTNTAGTNGQVVITNDGILRINYTPDFGFRGKDGVIVIAKDVNGRRIKYNITIFVGNAFKSLQPALAVRGMGCVQCHAQVSSNIITDFGYGNDYFFSVKPGESWWKTGGIYGDHDNNFKTMSVPSDKSVILPKASLPAYVASAMGQNTLADYIKSQFALSQFPGTRAAQIIEKSSVYIGAPTVSDITTAFKLLASERIKFFKNADSSLAYSGLKDEGTFFKNEGVLTCEGDLVVRGPLLLENLRIDSKNGCRLYVIGSVFMFGPITYENTDVATHADRNLQITSTKSISLGLGSVMMNGAHCDSATSTSGPSSLVNRYDKFFTVPGNYVRQSSDPRGFGQSIVAEADAIQLKAGEFYDASCRVEKRAVSFERILLNAPIVHSRYQGNISGTIISEFALMSLGAFKFSFDPVFARVPIFPFLEQSTYLDVKD